MSHRNVLGQQGMFILTNRPAGGTWLYPCALCNELETDEAGTLCPACAKPGSKRAKAVTRRKTVVHVVRRTDTKTESPTKTPAKKAAAPKTAKTAKTASARTKAAERWGRS